MEVPFCWLTQTSCGTNKCPRGFQRKLLTEAGKDGALPCCPVYGCVEPEVKKVVEKGPEAVEKVAEPQTETTETEAVNES